MPRVKSTDLRRKARALALQALFAADMRGDLHKSSLEWLAAEYPLPARGVDFAETLVRGVADKNPVLDRIIQHYAPAWPVNQLPLVDRNILRLALLELLYSTITPRKTAINEAVELAKAFGSESSARFVNGVLGSVMDGLEAGELVADKPVPEGR